MAREAKILQNRKEDKIYVAVIGDEIAGYVHASDYDTIYAPHMKNILGIAVAATWKRRGVGSTLLAEVESWAKETGACGVRLASGSSRMGAHAFYRSLGYSEDKMQLRLLKMF